MRPLRYSINVTLDGCCHHEAGMVPDEESMRYWTAQLERADALLFGRVTYEMMESAWRQPATGTWPDWMDEWEIPVRRDHRPGEEVRRVEHAERGRLECRVGTGRSGADGSSGSSRSQAKACWWVAWPSLALADLGLIDEYEFLVQPVLAGHGPTLLAGLQERIQLELVHRHEFRSGAVAMRYRPTRATD